MSALRVTLVWLLLALLSSVASAASSYTFRSDSYAWETAANAISTWDKTCTGYPGDDDKATITFTGTFKFTFAGTAYTSVRVLTNGGLQFGTDTGFFRSYTNTALPAGTPVPSNSGCATSATTNVILAYWTDLNPSQNGSGGVTWEQKGTAPNRYLVVSWNGVYQYSTTTPYTFQIILYESAAGTNGEFKFQYGNANATGSQATIGVQISDSDYTQYSYNSGYNANGSAIRWFVPSGTPTRKAEYRFDEYSYSGRVGEVADSSGNSNNGVRVGNATTVAGGYVCRGLSIPADTTSASHGVDTLLDVNSAIGDKGAVTFWYAANTAWNNSAAMLLDATTATARPFFLVRQGDGSLRATLSDGNGVVLTAVTGAQNVGAGVWRHVAVSWRLAAGNGQSSLRIYINGAQAGAVSSTTTGSLDGSIGTLFVGDNRGTAAPANSSNNSANGTIDELRVYNYDISALELTADMNPSHSCPPPLDHYEVWLPTTSLTCTPTTVTVKACATSSSTCSAEPSVNGTAVLTTTAGTLGSSLLTFNSGVATTTLSLPGGADGATATLSLSAESAAAANARQCCPNGSACFAANSCSTTFNRAGFIISSSAGGGSTAIASQTAGTNSGTYYLRAVRSNTSTQACEAALSGSNTVNWAYQCNDPAACSGANLMTVTGSAATTVQRNDASATLNYTGVPMAFDANGNAPFTVNFADAGKTTLYFNRTVNGDLIAGNSGAFVTRPAAFAVANVAGAVSPFTPNPAAASATSPNSIFVAAGAPFGARITAVTSGGATTPNFGKESSPEGVLLAPTVVLPSPGVAGTLANGSIAGSQFTNGVANVSNLSFSEVGIITITPSVADGDYLGAGNVIGTVTGNIGRFIPAGFAVSGFAVTHRSDLGCAPASTFTYLGENLRIAFTLTAQNKAGTPTQNYAGAFAKLAADAPGNFNLAGIAGTTMFKSGSLTLSNGAGTWTAGVAPVSFNASVARAAGPVGPFSTAKFGIAPVDTDLVGMVTLDLDTDSPPNGADSALLGQIPLLYGRLRLQNGMSAANRALTLPLTAQSWNGTAYTTNVLDSCTRITAANLGFGNFRKTLTAADAVMSPNAVTVNPVGSTFITLSAPGGGRLGSMDIAVALGAGATPADASCLKNPGGWTATTAASTGANLAALRGAWCGNAATSDPSARATWGLYRGADGIVYQRENY